MVIDAFGGDYAPVEIVKGAAMALCEMKDISLVLTGDAARIESILASCEYDKNRMQILHASEVIQPDEEPMKALRTKKDASIVRALEALRDKKAEVLISSGSTGAVLGGATTIVKRIKGVKRPGLAPLLPTSEGGKVMLIDCGANVDCKPAYLVQFAIMGSLYMEHVQRIASPRVGLINNGAEETKGNELTKAVYPLLQQAPVRFVGNCEPRDALSGEFDVIVADGFAGNVLLKSTEGAVLTLMKILKREMTATTRNKLGAALAKPAFSALKRAFDYENAGGAILLGIDGGVIKTHGNAKAETIVSAIRQGRSFIDGHVIDCIRDRVATIADAEASENE